MYSQEFNEELYANQYTNPYWRGLYPGQMVPGQMVPGQYQFQYPGQQPVSVPTPSGAPIGVPGTPGAVFEESYIENILRLNRGKVATIYMTFENNNDRHNFTSLACSKMLSIYALYPYLVFPYRHEVLS